MLKTNQSLTPNQQKLGQTYYLWFTRINAISFGCLAESIMILYAIKNGADDFIVGLLTSFFYLSMPFMIVSKKMVGKFGAARAYAISWAFRNASASLMIIVPLVMTKINSTAGLNVLIASAFGFFAFRSMGLTANTPIIGEITTKNNRGNYISQIWLHFNIFALITMIGLIFFLGKSDQIHTFQWIIAFGVFTGLIASTIIYRVPETEYPKFSGRQPIASSISYIRENSLPRKLLITWTSVDTIITLINPFSMVALKNGYFVSDHNAMFYALIQIIGGILASWINSMVLDRVGPRPMLILYSHGLLITIVLWIISPQALIIYYSAFVFLLLGLFRAGAMTTLAHYFLTIVPEENRVGANMFIYMISGTIAGLIGILFGGGLLKLIRYLDFTNLSIYRIYFVIIFILSMPLLFLIRRIERIADWHIRDVLGIFVSSRDIRALFTLQRLEKEVSFDQEFFGVQKLRESPSELSEKKLVAFLDSPRFTIRGKALGAIGQIKFGAKTAKALIKEVEQGEFTTAYIAAEILGDHHINEAIPVLRKSLTSEDVYLQGKSLLSLAQLGDENSFQYIEQIFKNSTNPRIIIHGARAIVQMKDIKRLILLLQKSISNNLPAQVKEELLYSSCELCGCGDEFYRFLKAYKNDPLSGFDTFKDTLIQFSKHLSQIFYDVEDCSTHIQNNHPLVIKTIQRFIQKNQNPAFASIKKFLASASADQISGELLVAILLILFSKNSSP